MEGIDNKINHLTDKVGKLSEYIDREEIKESIKTKLYINLKDYLDSPEGYQLSGNIITLFQETRDKLYQLAKLFIYNNLGYDRKDIEKEVNTFMINYTLYARKLLNFEIRKKDENFDIVINIDNSKDIEALKAVFENSLVEICEGKYNGQTYNKLNDHLKTFMIGLFKETTNIYRQ